MYNSTRAYDILQEHQDYCCNFAMLTVADLSAYIRDERVAIRLVILLCFSSQPLYVNATLNELC